MAAVVRVGVVLGTRPEAIKLAPVVSALRASKRYVPVVISTGQHRHLLDQLLGLFDVAPSVDLDLMVPGQSLSELAGRAVTRIGAELERLAIDVLVVQGDTTTTMAGAMAGFYGGVPVAHVEAGLRTVRSTGALPRGGQPAVGRPSSRDLHLAATERSARVPAARGDRPRDCRGHRQHRGRRAPRRGPTRSLPGRRSRPNSMRALPFLDPGRPILLVTAHRRENPRPALPGRHLRGRRRPGSRPPDLTVVFPVAPQPQRPGAGEGGARRHRPGPPDRAARLPADFVHLMRSRT